MVFLYLLCINGALVGMSLGVLLPVLFPGVCLGAALALLVAALFDMQSSYFFPAVGGVLAVLSATLSARYVPTECLYKNKTMQLSSPTTLYSFAVL
jgi:callose synthase